MSADYFSYSCWERVKLLIGYLFLLGNLMPQQEKKNIPEHYGFENYHFGLFFFLRRKVKHRFRNMKLVHFLWNKILEFSIIAHVCLLETQCKSAKNK